MRMRVTLFVLVLMLAACGGRSATPTAELPLSGGGFSGEVSPFGSIAGQGEFTIDVTVSGDVQGEIGYLLIDSLGGTFTLYFGPLPNPQRGALNGSFQLFVAGDIEPGTYDVVGAQDMALPEGAPVALATDLSSIIDDEGNASLPIISEVATGTVTFTSFQPDNVSGSLEVTAVGPDGTVTIQGSFANANYESASSTAP